MAAIIIIYFKILKKQEKRIRMKKTIALSTVLALAALGMACGEPAPATNANKAINSAMNQAANQMKEAGNVMNQAVNQMKEATNTATNAAKDATNAAKEVVKEATNKPADNTKKDH